MARLYNGEAILDNWCPLDGVPAPELVPGRSDRGACWLCAWPTLGACSAGCRGDRHFRARSGGAGRRTALNGPTLWP